MKNKFSERIGVSKPQVEIQVDSMTDALRNSIWNVIHDVLETRQDSWWRRYATVVAKHFRKTRVDALPDREPLCKRWLREYFYELSWFQVYDFV